MKFKAVFYKNPTGFIAVAVLMISALCCLLFNKTASVVLFAATAVIMILTIVYSLTDMRYVSKCVEELSDVFGEHGGADDFSMPCFICDESGNVIWYNKLFSATVIADSKNHALNAADFFADFDFSEVFSRSSIDAEYNGRKYTAFISELKKSLRPAVCICLVDDTYFKLTDAEYKLSRPFVMQILVDNIERLSRQFTDSKFALVSSGIESKIENWLRDVNVLFKRTGNGTFLVIGEKRDLDKLAENKFSVLTQVREYTFENTAIDATLSIGVGSGDNFIQSEERSKKALDMALGRGGDQAAVYTPAGHIYYGGVANRMNDNSRVSPRQTSANIATLCKKYDKVIVEGHRFSDFDSIGAAVGMCYLAQLNGVDAFVVADEKTTLASSLIDYLKETGFEPFISTDKASEMCDAKTLLAVVDTHREKLLDCPELFAKSGAQVVVDHHRRCEDYLMQAEVFYHLPSSSSASEMVAELIEYSSVSRKVPKNIATAMLAGIVLDTREFVLRTSQRTFEAAGFLRDNGAGTVQVKKFFSYGSEMSVLKNRIIDNAEIYKGFMISSTLEKTDGLRVVISNAADDMLSVEGVKASFVAAMLADDGTVQISARSLGEENVQLIMEILGGGGHSTMAAAQVKADSVDDAKILLKKAIDEYLLSK